MPTMDRVLCLTVALMAAPAMAADRSDPWEPFNRAMFRFNETLDKYLTKPAAEVYAAVMPQAVDDAVTRFFNNLQAPITIVNALLQGKGHVAATQTSRFMFNTTGGIAGFFDIATPMGLPRQKEDFGQTLAVWGVPSGPYLMLPLFGPSNPRDFVGRAADIVPDPRRFPPPVVRYGVTAMDLIDTRADLLPLEKTITGDRYVFLRDFYQQQRDFAIADGQVAHDDFLDDSLEMDSETAGSAKP